MDGFSNLGHGELGEGREEMESWEAARVGILRTDGGASIMVYPLCRDTLGQAIVVVAGGTVFCLEAAWEGMTGEDRERFRQAAAKGAGWIDRQADIPTLAERLTRGGRWCAHKGYSREAKMATRDPEAVAFGAVRPSQQSAGTIVVGGQPSDTAQYCDTCGGMTEASRRCSPNGSGMAQESWSWNMADRQLRQEMEEKAEKDADREIREESIESDHGVEPWMTIRKQTVRVVMEVTEAQGWGEQGSEGTIRGVEKDGRRVGDGSGELRGVRTGNGGSCYTEERWNRMEKWMTDNIRENAEVRRELERMRTLAQEEKGRQEKMLEMVQELREETYRTRRETIEGVGGLKKWLAKLGNEIKEGELIGFKNQAMIMDSLSKLHLNHNVSREDHKSNYREITMLETAMGSTVKGAVAEAVGRLRLELKRIFESLAENTPRPKEDNEGERTDRGGQSTNTDTDTDTEREEERTVSAIHKGYRGTIGGRRGEQARCAGRPSGRQSNPIVLDTPRAERKENKGKGKGRRPRGADKEASGETETRGAKTPEVDTTNEGELELNLELELEREPEPTHRADGRNDGSSSRGMPGRWDSSPTVSLDPTPIQGLTSPRKDLIPEEISAMRDEITISHIANEVPMEPELSPEPEEVAPTATATIRYDVGLEEEMLRQVEDESKRQGEAELRKEEERMLKRVLGTGGKGDEREARNEERFTKPEEDGDDEAAGRGGRGTKGKEEKMRKGWCDQCKEGCGEKEGTKDTKQEAQKGGEKETLKGVAEMTKGSELQRNRKESRAIERSDWGEEGWREAGIEPAVPETPAAGKERRVGFGDKSEQKTRKEDPDPIMLNAPKGPRSLPRFCNLCKIDGHNDLTCHLQGNAPTPGPSRHQKPFKTIQQRTPRRGLGAPRGVGSANTGREGGRRELELTKREGIAFQKEREPAPSRKELGELELESELGSESGLELDVNLEANVDLKALQTERPKPEPRKEGGREKRKGVEGESEERREKGKNAERQEGGGREMKDEQIVKVHLRGCRAPPTATAKGKELEWKRSLRRAVEAALKRADPGAQSSVPGTSYHFSRRNEKVVTVQVRNWTSRNEVQHIVLGATKKWEQNWTMTAAVIADWVEVVVEKVDGREKGWRASERVEEIARANGWTLAQKSPQCIGQRRNFDMYEGSPTGLAMTLIRRNGEPPAVDCEDSPYMVYGKKVVRKMKAFQLVRDGPHSFYMNEEGYKVSSRTSEHGPYNPPQWSPYKGRNACSDCGDWRHRRCGQDRRLPVCKICRGLHLDRECPRGVESREEVEKRKREVEELRREKERLEGKLRTIEEEMDERYVKGKEQDPRKHHGRVGKSGAAGKTENRTKGNDPHYTANE